MSRLYLDNAASTMPLQCAIENFKFEGCYYNASALNKVSRCTRDELERARKRMLSKFSDNEHDMMIFTSGGTESNNLSICTVASLFPHSHMIASSIEHASVINTLQMLKDQKRIDDFTLIPVDKNGFVDPGDIDRAVKPNTSLVCVMAANNEIGTIQPIEQIGLLCYTHNIVFMVDATQSVPQIRIGNNDSKLVDAKELGADIVTFSAHKFHGPMGVGGVYMARWLETKFPFMGGGHQEFMMRPGTENTPAILGMADAMDEIELAKDTELRDYLIDELLKIPGVHLNGSRENRLPYNVNIRLDGVPGETQALVLSDGYDIAVGTGSACNTGSLNPSHVLKAIGLSDEEALCSIRISMSRMTTKSDVDRFLECYKEMIDKHFCKDFDTVLS